MWRDSRVPERLRHRRSQEEEAMKTESPEKKTKKEESTEEDDEEESVDRPKLTFRACFPSCLFFSLLSRNLPFLLYPRPGVRQKVWGWVL
eukprot:g60987.t1